MKKLDIRAVIFDLDGTLIDTEPSALEAIRKCFAKWNIAPDDEDAKYLTGRSWESAFSFFFQRYTFPVPPEVVKEVILKQYFVEVETLLKIVPGAVEAVKALSAGYPLAIVSGSKKAGIQWAVKKLGIEDRFQFLFGEEDYPRSKPAPDGYLRAMSALQVSAENCLIFEDSTAGIQSGKSAGAWVAAVTSTNHFGQDFTGADFKIPDLRGVSLDWVAHLSID